MTDFSINKRGFWESDDASGHVYDKPLSDELSSYLKINKAESILDLGCGLGDYTRALKESGFYCDAYDGNPNTVALTKGLGKVLDFSEPFNLEKKYDWVLSLEVGEHIPKEFEKVFINNLSSHAAKGIILSWAVPGQPGDGHVNCLTNNNVISLLSMYSWQYEKAASIKFRKKATYEWFRNTIMVFKKIESKNQGYGKEVGFIGYIKKLVQ